MAACSLSAADFVLDKPLHVYADMMPRMADQEFH
jgi:hypothetical protein